jgi:DNA invertase Pin-like site-specific DNA recombinase
MRRKGENIHNLPSGCKSVLASLNEALMISARTKSALEAAKARGVALGGLRGDLTRMKGMAAKGTKVSATVRQESAAKRRDDLLPLIERLMANGASSLREIANGLNLAGLTTARGGELDGYPSDEAFRAIAVSCDRDGHSSP